MKNDGKKLEQIVRLIEESFKDSPNTFIYNNYKISNKDGRDREIDILIVSKINGFEINIAIECKDYNSKIPVEKVEAFHSKCLRLPQISKKIFVSTNGYQEDAMNAAKDFGIELLTAEYLTTDYINTLIPIKQMKPIVHGEVKNIVLNLSSNEEKLKTIQENYKGAIFNNDSSEETNILIIIGKAINRYKREIFGLALMEYMRLTHNQSDDIVLWVPFDLEFNGCYVRDEQDKLIRLTTAAFEVKVELTFIQPQNVMGRSLKHADGSIKAESLNLQINEGLQSHLVIKNNNDIDFFVTQNQETRKLETLFTYDPKTDKFTKG